MRSRTSFFNKAFSKSLLRRFWPLWALWLVLLLVIGVGDPLGYAPEQYASFPVYVGELNRVMLETGVALVLCAIAAGPLVAMAMLGYLYSPRACNTVCALPMRREETYFTAVITGLAPMLLADVLAGLVLLAVFGRVEGIDLGHIRLWLGLVLMGNVAFYGFACFCGVLTGNTVVLPLVYAALGVAAWVIENTARSLLSALIYGYTWDDMAFGWLSPLPCVTETLTVSRLYDLNLDAAVDQSYRWTVTGVPYLAGLCAAGLLLMLLAAPILKRRHMETAGDIVAVPVLRPIFRVCMAVGTGLVFSTFGSDAFFGSRPTAFAVFLMLIVGAALGWFLAEMLMKKTLRVFDHGWKGLALVCVCLVLPFLLAELDVTGYETRVPDLDTIESVSLGYTPGGEELTDAETIAAFRELHSALISHKAENDKARRRAYTMLPLTYKLKDGECVTRLYRVPNDERAYSDPDSDIAAYQRFMNLPALILRRAGADRGIKAEDVYYAYADVRSAAGNGVRSETLTLTPEQAVSLLEEGVYPDAREGNIARWYAWSDDELRGAFTNVTLTLALTGYEKDRPVIVYTENGAAHLYSDGQSYYNLEVLTSSAHTIRWLEENLGLTPVPEA